MNDTHKHNTYCERYSARASGIEKVHGPLTENGPSGEGGTQQPLTSTVSSIERYHPHGRLTSSGPPHLKSLVMISKNFVIRMGPQLLMVMICGPVGTALWRR
ncbi:hypothetical protein KIN20_020869 [Parelaphostrongylus tenuis]|uniref:Uncharacterized protein n=1 Tax=Parelaphostrongylus tenuis TaxID=148309 RepID=A0AAD5QTS5_PARTN|nr:hypothetical protein KIN20_020869 [Parelaphostrongylus tenuis]